jgi:O-antigen/teichoic acid export membrane protein
VGEDRRTDGQGTTVIARWRGMDSFGKFSLILSLALIVWFTYSTIAWLLSSHPFGALVPGVLLYCFASGTYGRLRYANPSDRAATSLRPILIAGAVSAISIVLLWTLADKRNDPVYHHSAVTMSLWGGAIVVLAVFILLVLATPRGRSRMRKQRAARMSAIEDSDPEQ